MSEIAKAIQLLDHRHNYMLSHRPEKKGPRITWCKVEADKLRRMWTKVRRMYYLHPRTSKDTDIQALKDLCMQAGSSRPASTTATGSATTPTTASSALVEEPQLKRLKAYADLTENEDADDDKWDDVR